MAQTGNAHHWGDRLIGKPKTVNEQYLERLKELASYSPRQYGYPFERWTGQWLSKHLVKEFKIQVSSCHMNRLLKKMGLSTRPKDNTTKNQTSSQQNSDIKIGDLPSNVEPSFLWQFSLMKTSN
jgi:putative transposase